MIKRLLEKSIRASLLSSPVTVILGARQVGKTTLARALFDTTHLKSNYLDLERPSDLNKLVHQELIKRAYNSK